jgi:hypothetical protein
LWPQFFNEIPSGTRNASHKATNTELVAGENSPVLLRGIKRRIIMNLTKKIENLFVAITFAEAGEFETAREYLRDEERPRQFDRVVPTLRPRKELKAPGLRK